MARQWQKGQPTRAEQLRAQMNALMERRGWKRGEIPAEEQASVAAFAGHLRGYSQGNVMNLYMQAMLRQEEGQNAEATELKGLKEWRDFGRKVRKGERGWLLFAPNRYKEEDGESDGATIKGFHAVYVFDVSQTEPLGAEEAAE